MTNINICDACECVAHCSKHGCIPLTAQEEPVIRRAEGGAASALSRETLIELIDAQLTSVYHCTRVWEAWDYSTMSEDDFTEARGSSLAGEIADEVLAVLSGCTAESIPSAAYLLGHQHGLDWAAQLASGCDPRTGDWLYDDREDLADAIHRGPEVPVEWSAALQGDAARERRWLCDRIANLVLECEAWKAKVKAADALKTTASGEWRIDHSAGRPILTYKNCSVIEAEDAEYVLRLVAADPTAPNAHGGRNGE